MIDWFQNKGGFNQNNNKNMLKNILSFNPVKLFKNFMVIIFQVTFFKPFYSTTQTYYRYTYKI